MNDIHLYIGDTEVEFSSKPEILYTYQVNDLVNPTIVKNSFSKPITIKGTKSNNHLFGQIWNVQRIQVGGADNASNVYFNASKKIDFQLFIGNELYESGYVKLDEVRKIGNDYEYDITLFGGLGSFFYNLAIADDGNQMKLSDLVFDKDLDFTINIETVQNAWQSLKENKDDKWQTINFMPAYNGLPDDFDSNKMLIDISATNLTQSKKEDGKTYTPREKWVMAELPENMSEWQTRDIRSYLQRPCIRMKEIIKACCNPINNGGFEVELDTDFFNENNDFYQNTWLSLPMIQTLEYDSAEQDIKNSKLVLGVTEGDVNGYMYQPLTFDTGEFPSSVMSFIYINTTINPNLPYKNSSYAWFWNKGGDSYHTGWWCVGSLFCQLLAFNGDTVVGASNVYNLTTPIYHNGKLYYGDNRDYAGGHSFTPYMGKSIQTTLGYFEPNGFTRENATEPTQFTFYIENLTSNVTELKMCYYWGASKDKLDKAKGAYCCFDRTTDVGWIGQGWGQSWSDKASQMSGVIKYHNIKAVLGSSIGRTGTNVTKRLILNTEATPCDYLLSYCKMFGLYFTKSPFENKIKIQTRKSFYEREKINDISKDIDYSKNVTITPIAFGSKWVEFNQEQDETHYSKDYITTKGLAYGSKVINTGYEFDSDKSQLLENNVIKSAIEGLEKSKYFTCYNNDSKVRPFFGYGMKYELYNGTDSIEMKGTNASGSNLLGINEDANLKYYDLFPKVQFHDSNNEPTEGNNCLVFFSGFKKLTQNRANPITYILSDDSYYQNELNESTPCWLFVSGDKDVNGKPIARKLTELPVFERYLTDASGTTIKKSLDFGTPQELFIPKYSITEDVNIYSNYWKTFLEDLYDVNTKILTLYVNLKDKVGYELLRQFYWFENSIWRINKISDWNIGLTEPTKVEFIKVQDLKNYATVTQKKSNKFQLSSDKYIIEPNGDDVLLTLSTSDENEWRIVTNNKNIILSQTQGLGNSTIQLTIPQTQTPNTQSFYSITAIDNEGNTSTVNLTQSYQGETQFTLFPPSLIVSSTGGEYDIDFNWKNQGDNEITDAQLTGDINATIQIDGFHASISVTENQEPDTVISGKVLFSNELYGGELIINQIPQSLSFSKDGGEYEFMFNYEPNISYSNLPYWASIIGNKLTVLPNYYETERSADIIIQNEYSFAYLTLHQAVGKAPIQETAKVSPTNFYFSKEGGTQFLNIQLQNTWVLTKVGDWFTTNVSNGDGATIVCISCGENTEGTKTGSITVKDVITGDLYHITVKQLGGNDTQDLSVTPPTIETDHNGGEYELTLTYNNRNGDYVNVECSKGLTATDLKWVGDVATLKVKVPVWTLTIGKRYKLTFTTPIGTLSVEVIQSGVPRFANVDKSNLSFESDGGTETVKVTTNEYLTVEVSDSWISTDSANVTEGTTELIVQADENTSTTSRVGYIYLKYYSTVLATITVSQKELVEELSVTPSSIEFGVSGGDATINIICNTDWTIELNE
jgi:hypothetical protein